MEKTAFVAVVLAVMILACCSVVAVSRDGLDHHGYGGGVDAARRLHPANFSRDELESVDLFLMLLLRVATFALVFSLALPVIANMAFLATAQGDEE